MSRFDLLNIPEFEEMDEMDRNVYLREAYSGYPYHSCIPSMTMYHLKKVLTKGDLQDILDWYGNLQELKKGSEYWGERKRRKEIKREVLQSWYLNPLTSEEIKVRDYLIHKEREFRFKLVQEYQNSLIYRNME